MATMDRKRVKELLHFFRGIDGEIILNRKVLSACEGQYYTMGSSVPDGMPRGGSKISRPTENIALNVPPGISKIMVELRQKISDLIAMKQAIWQEIDRLPLREKKIIYDFYITGMQWVQISAQMNYSETQCKKIRNLALDRLASHFSENGLILKFAENF